MDLASRNLEKVLINDPDLFRDVSDYVTLEVKSFANAISVDFEDGDIFARFGISAQIDLALKKEFQMSSGAHLVFEQTEALVSVDVNSGGKLNHGDSNIGGADAQDQLAIQVNMEAAEIIPSQLRLRNLAGLIVKAPLPVPPSTAAVPLALDPPYNPSLLPIKYPAPIFIAAPT